MDKVKNIVALHLFSFATASVAFAFVTYIGDNKSSNHEFRIQREEVLSCSPKKSTSTGHSQYQETSGKSLIKDHQSKNNTRKDKNDGNGCSHQLGAGTLCAITGLKRRPIKASGC